MKLLALSGGSDSLALFHMLLDRNASFHVAHLDHGWREESLVQAEQLKELVESRGIPFHSKRVQMEPKEEIARRERHQFFRELCKEHGCDAVLLAHHADDQAETVLKRVFEGGDLSSLQGMKSQETIDGLNIERPLLGVWKSELLEYLSAKGAIPFEDSSNRDTKYLRARMREILIPFLNEKFGKNVQPALERLHHDSMELAEYLEKQIAPYLALSTGRTIDLSNGPVDDFILKAVLRRFCKGSGVVPQREPIERAARLIRERALDKTVTIGKTSMRVHAGKVSM